MSEKKRVLITGKGSYIGTSVKSYLLEIPGKYEVEELETKGLTPSIDMFEGYDAVFHVAGIAHIKETEENKHLYYEVNRDLTIKIAEAAKAAGVKQFIVLSSMSVYGLTTGHITKSTEPKPVNAYGDSKLQADIELEKLADDSFKVAVLRPPMVYGKGCKGNYQQLRSFALKSPIFPKYENERSMLYIGNLCEFVKECIDFERSGLFFPQNEEYTRTSDMVKTIAEVHGKKIRLTKIFNWAVKIAPLNVVKKVFGDLVYERADTVGKYGFSESIRLTEDKIVARVESKGSSNHLKLEHAIKHNPVIQGLYRFGMSGIFQLFGKFLKIDNDLVLMNGHSYKFNDSPRAIYRKMCELGLDEKYHIVWALNEPDSVDIPGNAEKIKMDTLQYFITALKSKYWISCVGIERGLHFKKKKQIYLNTWHGAAINVSGNGVPGRNDFHWGHIDYFCMCGKLDEINFGRDMELNPKSYLRCGYPRNDVLSIVTPELQNEVRKKLGLQEGKKYVLYAPTWRDSRDGGESFQLAPPINWNKWKEKLGDEYIVLLRTHPYTTKLMNMKFNDFILDFTSYPEVNDLLIASDILISDYSSILLDFCITEKPMICFGYDIEEYKRVRGGFYYDLEKEIPNGVMKNEDQIIEHLMNLDFETECEKTKLFKNNHCEYEKGHATIDCINTIFGTSY